MVPVWKSHVAWSLRALRWPGVCVGLLKRPPSAWNVCVVSEVIFTGLVSVWGQ